MRVGGQMSTHDACFSLHILEQTERSNTNNVGIFLARFRDFTSINNNSLTARFSFLRRKKGILTNPNLL